MIILSAFSSCISENNVKGSSDPRHFTFEINVGKSRVRHRTTLKLNDAICNQFRVDLEIQFQSRSMSDPTLSDIDFKIKMVWVCTTLKSSSDPSHFIFEINDGSSYIRTCPTLN